MKWETFEVDVPASPAAWSQLEYIARRGLRDALMSYELQEAALLRCHEHRQHLDEVLQATRAAGLVAVTSALEHAFRCIGPRVIPHYRKHRWRWRKFGWLVGHVHGFRKVLQFDQEDAQEETIFLQAAVLVRNQFMHANGSIVGCGERREVERWVVGEDSIWIDEQGVFCLGPEMVGRTFDHACSLVLFLAWHLKSWEQV